MPRIKNHKYESPNPLKKPRVARHFRSLSREIHTNPSAHMFVQDVHISVMPIGGRFSQESDFSVEIQGSSKHEHQAVSILQSLTDRDLFSEPNLKEMLSDVVNKIALYLASGGRSVYEIIRDQENEGAWRLYSFPDKRLFRVFGKCVQIVPKSDRQLWKKLTLLYQKKISGKSQCPKCWVVFEVTGQFSRNFQGLHKLCHLF